MASSSVPMNNVLFFALLFTTLVVAHEEKSSNYFLTDEDFERARSTDFSSAPFNSSVMENPDLFEGDIMDPYVSLKGASPSERENMYKMMDAKFFGNALRDPNALWPKGVVPYMIHGGEQQLSLGNRCGYVGIAEHEMMHAIGFHHEQNRADRDDYVRVLFENINPPMRCEFFLLFKANNSFVEYIIKVA
ncbi:unnamed protein product [Anisakis simplex]|uniref:Metalloendopeptidase n=1 Tax=Anisakis simplex TaxID=6269 RepID=A0A0M3K299_ANISI|nr:unnamed protein product [Anisakis simplex]